MLLVLTELYQSNTFHLTFWLKSFFECVLPDYLQQPENGKAVYVHYVHLIMAPDSVFPPESFCLVYLLSHTHHSCRSTAGSRVFLGYLHMKKLCYTGEEYLQCAHFKNLIF